MFFKKNEEPEHYEKWYCVGIMTDNGLEDEEYDVLSKRILDSVQNVSVISDLVRVEWDRDKLRALNERFGNLSFSNPWFIINEFIPEDIKKERKLTMILKLFSNLYSSFGKTGLWLGGVRRNKACPRESRKRVSLASG